MPVPLAQKAPLRHHRRVTDATDLARQLAAALGDGYSVERALGEGGFAVVFLVRDLSLKRHLAVKVMSPDVITSKTMLERFRREAEIVAQLSHPNIVPLHFIGERDGLLYLAMQYVDGGSLADRIKREKQLPVDDAVRIAAEVASALSHAHKRGVVHRDIKPANVLIDAESGRCLVTDFGIARSQESSSLTATGMMVGTPAYVSPEQVTGESMDHRVDIFALGVMLYEMLAGRVPYDAPTPSAALMKRLGGPPEPVTEVRPEVPEYVAGAVTACLAASPADRLQSATDVIAALGGDMITTGGRATKTIPIARRSKPIRAIVGAAIALALIAGAWRFATTRSTAAAGPPPSASKPVDLMLVRIPAGTYPIGTDAGPSLARPRHSEQVAAFSIERTEVTVGAYRAFMAATGAPAPWTDAPPDDRVPVTRVPWGDAANYCVWRYKPSGRLPTEVEWEAAARGQAGRNYPYGDVGDAANANTSSAHRAGVVPVGSFARGATPEGLQDMSGNVWEWTSSSLRGYPGGVALPDSMSQYRVIRGGAFDTNDSLATGWVRGYAKATALGSQLPNTGFRCVAG
jgi:serine/threonine protein kinase